MIIQEMFDRDINRYINSVVKVDQDSNTVQELEEYVVTKELKEHFRTFFTNYAKYTAEKIGDTGVWISGFYGSGKSHFLKMLSYLLANKEIQGVRTVERFRSKFADDPQLFALIEKETATPTDTILFNIDVEGPINKDKTAVLRVFAKMFYKYCGYYGENLKVAKLEQYIDKQGLTEEFCRVFEENNGQSWLEGRETYDFQADDVVATLCQVCGMSEQAAWKWIESTDEIQTSVAQLVTEIKEYMDRQPADFRLLFMIDEVGQYVGTSKDLLMNLQSLTETLGEVCQGRVWVACTAQEAMDDIIQARMNEFSRIQARFKTRLSLSSASVDEVIQVRLLQKQPSAYTALSNLYGANASVLRNIFIFTDAVKDMRGPESAEEFAKDFPFVPYQFIILQKVFDQIRLHGNLGKHYSNSARSMLEGFQLSAQAIKEKDEYALAPFQTFYTAVAKSLDSSIRDVIERCQRAAEGRNGLEPQDVEVLKLLYLIRYIDDIKACADNIVILMADDIRMDKVDKRKAVLESLDRLWNQNYIGRNGDTYQFLTNEEQDIEREIRETVVEGADVVNKITRLLFDDVYSSKKYRYKTYDFPYDRMVDDVTDGLPNGNMLLKVVTDAADGDARDHAHLMLDSKDRAVLLLGDTPYYKSLERALMIRKYVKTRNVAQLPKSMQDIIRSKQDEATQLENGVIQELQKAIEGGRFYVDGEEIRPTGNYKAKIDFALNQLVEQRYKKLGLVDTNIGSDAEVQAILAGNIQMNMAGKPANQEAADEVIKYLTLKEKMKLPVTMADVQSHFGAIPYGWKEMDIVAVVALLMVQQRVTLKYAGDTLRTDNKKLLDLLRKRTEVGKVSVKKRIVVNQKKLMDVRTFLKGYFNVMSVPEDEDGLVKKGEELLSLQKEHYQKLAEKYSGHNYPDKHLLNEAVAELDNVLSAKKDNVAFIDRLLAEQTAFEDLREDLEDLEEFFRNQVGVFDKAVKLLEDLKVDNDYFTVGGEAYNAMNKMRRLILGAQKAGSFNYREVPSFNGLITIVEKEHNTLLSAKRQELLEFVAFEEDMLKNKAAGHEQEAKVKDILAEKEMYFDRQKNMIGGTTLLNVLDGMKVRIDNSVSAAISRVEIAIMPPAPPKPVKPVDPQNGGSGSGSGASGGNVDNKEVPVAPKKRVKSCYKMGLLTSVKLETEADIDMYVDELRTKLKFLKQGFDVLELK